MADNSAPSSADVIEGMREALEDAISLANVSAKCPTWQKYHFADCIDRRCRDNDRCMVERVNRWRNAIPALALPDSKPDKGGA